MVSLIRCRVSFEADLLLTEEDWRDQSIVPNMAQPVDQTLCLELLIVAALVAGP